MSYIKVVAVSLTLGCLVMPARAELTLKSKKDKESYGIGVDVAKNFKHLGIDVNLEALIRGLRDGYSGSKLAMREEEIAAVMAAYQNELKAKQMAAQKAMMDANQKAGEDYMAKHRAEEGVVTLPSGLQYKILKPGEGPKPKPTDVVECRYKGYFVDGKEFDNSERAGGLVSFNVQGVIAGWQEALQLMPVGSRWQLVVPPQLAYGVVGAGRQIGPNATLIFEIELVSIKQSESPATGESKP